MKHPVTHSANDKPIYVQLIHSKVAEKISREPHLLTLAQELMQKEVLNGEKVAIEIDMKRTIGNTEVIETKDGDSVFYAQARKSPIYTRYVKHRKAEPTSYLTLSLQKDEAGEYELLDITTGTYIPPIPGESDEVPESKAYWQTHAVVMNGQAIQAKTVTTDCPY